MKKSLKKHRNNSQKLVDIDYLAGCRISDCLPIVYEDGLSMKKMNDWLYNFTINKHLWTDEFSTCEISENGLYYI